MMKNIINLSLHRAILEHKIEIDQHLTFRECKWIIDSNPNSFFWKICNCIFVKPLIVWRIKVENAKLILWSCFFVEKRISNLTIFFHSWVKYQIWSRLAWFKVLFLNLGIRGGGGDSTLVVLVTGHLDEAYNENKNKMHEWIKKGKDKN